MDEETTCCAPSSQRGFAIAIAWKGCDACADASFALLLLLLFALNDRPIP